jgi:hypothetical protein
MQQRASTTNFSGVALGTTVHRLIGAVTLYGKQVSPLRLVFRGAAMGIAAGVAALMSITSLRWAHSDGPLAHAVDVASEVPAAAPVEAEQDALIRGAMLELDAGKAESALTSANALLARHPASKWVPKATVLKVTALLRLGRIAEAEAAAKPLIGAGTPEGYELRVLLERHHEKSSNEQ